MQRKKNVQLLILLSVLLAATAFVLFMSSSEKTAVDKSLFQIPEQEKIDRVTFESAKGKTEIKYDGTRWLVNNQYETDRQLIKIFFATTLKAEAKREIPSTLSEKISSEMKARGTKVSFFMTGNLVKEFWVSGNDQRTETYFAYNNETPYLVTIPGYRAYVASIFEMTSNDWRDKRIFNFNGQNFKSLDASFPSNPKEDFKIVFTGKTFEVEGVNALDTTQLNSYLDAVSFIQADKILDATEAAKFDTLLHTTPLAEVMVKDIGGTEYSLAIFPFGKQSSVATGKAFKGEVVQFSLSNIATVLQGKSRFIKK